LFFDTHPDTVVLDLRLPETKDGKKGRAALIPDTFSILVLNR